MSKIYISQISDRDQVTSIFLVKEKSLAMAKNGKPYMTLQLMDKTGEIEGRIWDNVDAIAAKFAKNDFVSIVSKASVYLGKMQLIISELSLVPEEEVKLADFLPESDSDIDQMLTELSCLVASISDVHISALMSSFLDDADFMTLYRVAPAAKGMHHVYLGGLLEHSLAVARLVDLVTPLYPGLNRDLLVAGALLHDIGKVREMTYLRSFDYTDEGKLLGHITIGTEMIQEKISTIQGFPLELGMLIKHMILSHHGQYEFGSPKRPKTIEATVLNYLDDLDSKINGIRTHIRKEGLSESRWTSYHRLYDRYFYKQNCLVDEESEYTETASTEEDAAPQAESSAERPDKKGFGNTPFEQLQGKNLELF